MNALKKGLMLGALLFFPTSIFAAGEAILYVGEGCPHCAQVEKYLEDTPTDLSIQIKEVYNNPDNATEFTQVCEEQKIPLLKRGVPMLYVGENCYIGDKDIISYLQSINAEGDDQPSVIDKPEKTYKTKITIPIVIGAALVDAINPCAFAVLIILISALLITSTRKRALYAGLAFSGSIFLSYFFMGLGLYRVIASVETSHIFMTVVGILAIVLGLFNLKDYFRYGKGVLMEVPMSRRPRLRRLLESVTSPLGAFFIGFLVSLFLLPCTSGPYIVIISMLGHEQSYMTAVWYLLLYNIIFVLPMVIITLTTYKGLDIDTVEDMRQKHLRTLHLIAGILLLTIGILVLI